MPPAVIRVRFRPFVACAALLAAACGKDASTGGSDTAPTEVRLYAAASLTDALTTLVSRFDEGPGRRVVVSFGASSTLAQQLREGAPPGVFVSASAEWADRVEEWGLAEPGSRADLLTNSLVGVVPRGSSDPPARIEDLADARFARIALADPTAVPAGRYARAALEACGVWDRVERRVVAAQDVRGALAWVARGEAPVGIVYATDARSSPGVDVAFRVPAETHPPVVYPVLLGKGAGPAARELLDFLRSAEAREVFTAAGFAAPSR